MFPRVFLQWGGLKLTVSIPCEASEINLIRTCELSGEGTEVLKGLDLEVLGGNLCLSAVHLGQAKRPFEFD